MLPTIDADALDLASVASCSENSEQQSWYYYLAETALRRIIDRIVNAFYASGFEPGATLDVQKSITMAEGFELELDAW